MLSGWWISMSGQVGTHKGLSVLLGEGKREVWEELVRRDLKEEGGEL